MYDEYPEASAELDELEKRLRAITPEKPHDKYVIASIEEALAAAREGNFGVGAVIVNPQGEIVERGHNHVFQPHFRSDIHAEMDTMNKFEDNNTDVTSMRDYMLFTSLEPCPMCLTRLITSGIGKVYQAAPDVESGMVAHLDKLTKVWIELAESQEFAPADCNPALGELALDVFLWTANHRTQALMDRR